MNGSETRGVVHSGGNLALGLCMLRVEVDYYFGNVGVP